MESSAAVKAEEKIAEREGGAEAGAPAPAKRGGARPGAGRKKTKTAPKTGTPAPPEEPITEAEIAMFATLGNVLWGISARLFDMEPLTEKEQHDLGAAMAPVARKYMPVLDDYAPEVTLIVMVGGLVVSKKRKKPTPVEGAVIGDYADIEINPPNGKESAQ